MRGCLEVFTTRFPFQSLRIQALLFDFDGIVVDTEPLHELALQKLYANHNFPLEDPHFYALKGRPATVVFHEMAQQFGGDAAELRTEKDALYLALYHNVPLVDGVAAFLEAVYARFPLALVTSADRHHVELAMDRHPALKPYFSEWITAQDVTHPKPHPQPYRMAAARLGVDPDRCLVIEDSVLGVQSGVASGASVAGLVGTFREEALRDAGATIIFEQYAQLHDVLCRDSAS